MSSKLEILERYQSSSKPKDEKKLKKKRKKNKHSTVPSRIKIHDEDHEWQNDAPTTKTVNSNWEMNAVEDEGPVVVTEENYDGYDLKIGQRGQWEVAVSDKDISPKRRQDYDNSPPRRRKELKHDVNDSNRGHEKDNDPSPPRRTERRDLSPSRYRTRDNDASPPRRKKPDYSPARRRRSDSKDVSPPRRRERGDSRSRNRRRVVDGTPPRRGRGDNRNDDASPRIRRESGDSSPPRRRRRDDNNSPRRRRNGDTSSPLRRRRYSKDNDDASDSSPSRRRDRGDSSPPRRPRRDNNTSPPRRGRIEDSDDDASPPRRRKQGDSSPSRRKKGDISPSRRHRSDSKGNDGISPPRSKRDASTPRRRRSSSKEDEKSSRFHGKDNRSEESNTSPSRKHSNKSRLSKKNNDSLKHRAGLHTKDEFKERQDEIRQEEEKIWKSSKHSKSKSTDTVYRDRKGRKLDMLNEMKRQEEIREGKRKRREREEYEWGTGKVQKQELKSQADELKAIKEKKFSRFENDEELETQRKSKVHIWDDPMESRIFKKANKSLKKDLKKKSKSKNFNYPLYRGPPAPPNRFNIPPGYRWDGVVRGNGWEEKVLMKLNEHKCFDEEKYKQAVADM